MLNKIVLMGRLTRDPELRRTGNNISVASFTIACDRDRAVQGAEKETDFFDCVAWRSTGDFVAKHFRKGRMIIVSGRLENRKWTDKEGNKRVSNEIVVDDVYFGDSKKDDPAQGGSQAEHPSGSYATPPAGNGGYNQAPSAPPAGNYGQQGGWPGTQAPAAAPAPAQTAAPAPAPQYGGWPQQPAPAAAPAYPDVTGAFSSADEEDLPY